MCSYVSLNDIPHVFSKKLFNIDLWSWLSNWNNKASWFSSFFPWFSQKNTVRILIYDPGFQIGIIRHHDFLPSSLDFHKKTQLGLSSNNSSCLNLKGDCCFHSKLLCCWDSIYKQAHNQREHIKWVQAHN